jgi:soluble lytic murein transglycosylase
LYIKQKENTCQKVTVILLVLLILTSYKLDFIGKAFYPYLYRQTVEKYASTYGVDPLLVIAVIREESHFIPLSSSHKGAMGLMQLMPETAKEIAAWLHEDYTRVDLKKPEDNIRYGTWYLAALNKEYSGTAYWFLPL